MTSGISIVDLGPNEFRLDLLEYMKQHEDIETAPKGLHTVVGQTEDCQIVVTPSKIMRRIY